MNNYVNDQSLWNNPAIEETIKNTDPEKYFKYQKMTQSLFDKSNIDNPLVINIEAATQIKLMLRDGLHPNLLEENEKELFISTFGQESFDEFLTQHPDFVNTTFGGTSEATSAISTLRAAAEERSERRSRQGTDCASHLQGGTAPSTPTTNNTMSSENLVSQKVAHSTARKRPRSRNYKDQPAAKRIVFF